MDLSTECIVCTEGYGQVGGYRRISRGRMVYAHRWAYEQAYGPVPDGMEVGHLCHNPECWNAEHLRAMTHAENMKQRSERQTHCKRGHEFTPENTTITSGRRRCKACARGYYHERKSGERLQVLVDEAMRYFDDELDRLMFDADQYEEMAKRAADLGSRRLSDEQLRFDKTIYGRESKGTVGR